MNALRLSFSITTLTLLPLLSACGVGEATAVSDVTSDAVPVPVEVAYPTRADIFATYDATTTIGSDGDAPVLARVPGEVIALLVEEGEWVKQGQVLARLDGERLRLEMLAAKSNLNKARGEYDRYVDLHEKGLVSASMFEGLKYDLDSLVATYELAKLNYNYSAIRATIAGYVSNRNIKLGQSIRANEEAFRITDTSQLVAYLQIPQTELDKFSAGHSASLSVDAMPNRQFAAEIARISPTIDIRNGTFRATAFIDNSEGKLAPGMFARFTVAYEKHADALLIPRGAIVEEDERTSVYVVRDGQVTRRTIETGIRTADRVEVLNGLSIDEQIVTVGQSALRDGSKVLAQTNSAESAAG